MNSISLQNPIFAAYAIAASLMVLKVVAMSWLTVWHMMREKGGYRAPEDLRKTALNPKPNKKQLEANERVERVRRIQQNDLENVPFFLVAGFLYVLTAPPLWLAHVLFYGYVISRLLHFGAYYTAQTHDMRATLWTIGSLIMVFMSLRVVWVAVGF
jgi:glutathione S-transferase